MAKQVDITLAKIRNSRNLAGSKFEALYVTLMTRSELSEADLIDVLRFGVVLSRSSHDAVRRLGYRIFLEYAESTGDYAPVRAIAKSRDLVPIVATIDRLYPEMESHTTLSGVLFDAHMSNFAEEAAGRLIYRTRGQMELREFNLREDEAIVVAPTSYGKSEMLISRIAANLGRRICVLVPSRALISQTRANIIADPRIRKSRIRIMTHPDAFNGDDKFIAVMTQERLQRLLIDNPLLALDQLLVDEAHNLLPSDSRAKELSQAILISRSRNERLMVTYYTPFIASADNLRHYDTVDKRMQAKVTNEHVKVEKFVVRTPGMQTRLYDQFLNRFINLPTTTSSDEVQAILDAGGRRSLVYVNRPRDAQNLAARMTKALKTTQASPAIARAIEAISDLIDPSYSLVESLRHGVLFHHGQIPDLLRSYIESLFREDESSEPRYLVTTSTLLEGVNTPADRLIMMTGTRGRANLTRSAFRNLVGRVGRFSEVFSENGNDLRLLQPEISLIPSTYSRSNWNVEDFLEKVANEAVSPEDFVLNPFLEATLAVQDRPAALEYLENLEPGSTELMAARKAVTEIGKLCFKHGVHDFDIVDREIELQARVDLAREAESEVDDTESMLELIAHVFLESVELPDDDALARLRDYEGARRFYSMFLDWRSRNEPFRLMIRHLVRYWSEIDEEYVFIGRGWGEVSLGGHQKLFVQMAKKSKTEMINLAVVKIKEEQDFVDYKVMKYVEVLYKLDIVSESLYFRIKYGTNDAFTICLLRNGFSPDLARLVRDNYQDLVIVDLQANEVGVPLALAAALTTAGQNDVLIYEAESLINMGTETDT